MSPLIRKQLLKHRERIKYNCYLQSNVIYSWDTQETWMDKQNGNIQLKKKDLHKKLLHWCTFFVLTNSVFIVHCNNAIAFAEWWLLCNNDLLWNVIVFTNETHKSNEKPLINKGTERGRENRKRAKHHTFNWIHSVQQTLRTLHRPSFSQARARTLFFISLLRNAIMVDIFFSGIKTKSHCKWRLCMQKCAHLWNTRL